MKYKVLFTLTLISALLFPAVAAAKIHRCVDDGGHVTFQQIPCPDVSSVPRFEPQAAGRERPPLWRLRAGDATVFLLGSIHFGKAGMYPLPEVVESAFTAADILVVEVNTAALHPAEIARRVALQGTYQDGGGLRQVIDEPTWRKVQRATEKVGVPIQVLARQKPWLAAMTLSVAALQNSGYGNQWGVDNHFLQRAMAQGRPVLELETLEAQLRLFDELPLTVQQALLRQSIHELDRSGEYFAALLDAWQQGDVVALLELIKAGFEDSPEGREMYEVFLTRRNHRMAGEIERLLTGARTYFVIVGAAHLVGGEGIVRLLERKGYRVERL